MDESLPQTRSTLLRNPFLGVVTPSHALSEVRIETRPYVLHKKGQVPAEWEPLRIGNDIKMYAPQNSSALALAWPFTLEFALFRYSTHANI